MQRRGQKGGSIDDRDRETWRNATQSRQDEYRNSGKILKNIGNPWKSLSRAVNPVKHSIRLSHCEVKAKKQMKFCSIPSAGIGGQDREATAASLSLPFGTTPLSLCLQLEDAAFDPHERPRCPVSALTKSKEAVQESKRAQRTSPRDEESTQLRQLTSSSSQFTFSCCDSCFGFGSSCSALLWWPLPVHLFGLCRRRTDVKGSGGNVGSASEHFACRSTWRHVASRRHSRCGGKEPSSSAASGHVLLQCQLLGPRLTSFGSKRACSVCQSERDVERGGQGYQRCRVNVSFT